MLPPESPYLYGLHPNAEIGFLTTTSDNLFKTVLEMQPRDTGGAGGGASSREEKVSGELKRAVLLPDSAVICGINVFVDQQDYSYRFLLK